MKTRTLKKPEQAPTPELKVVRSDESDESDEVEVGNGKRGGARPGAGRPAYLREGLQKEKSAYVSMTDREKERFKKQAAKEGLTLSFFLRKQLGLPIE